jgi:hypothetical protein
MHLLFAHHETRLPAYGTVVLCVEDSMESIHAMVNRLSRVYSSLDGERKTHCIVKSITASKQQLLAVQSNKKKKRKRPLLEKKQRRRKGDGVLG